MHHSIKIFFFSFLVLIFSLTISCSKILNNDPTHEVDGTNGFTTIDEYNFALIGTYSLFQQPNYYGSTAGANAFVCLPDMMSDDLTETNEDLGNYTTKTNWLYAADDTDIANTWTNAYAIIAQANVVLRGIDDLPASKKLAVNRIKGQALAIRAMVHFDVLRYWAKEFDRNSTAPGIPYITVFDYNQKPSRGTVKQTYDSIETDLQLAKKLLSNTDKIINESGRAYIDTSVVNAISARMYLYANEMDSAIKYATLVINQFPLADKNDFKNIWTDASDAEVIWSCIFNSGDDYIAGNVYDPTVDRNSYKPTTAFLNLYDKTNDVRYNSYFKQIDSRTVLSKYLAKQTQLSNPDGVVNFKAFRTGEMYLIRAEAYARNKNDNAGLNDLNTLRAARITNYKNGNESGNELINAIAVEREKELICEGHRWFDLKRTTKKINRTNCNSFCTLTPDRREWAWPIPLGEINANPNIIPQNEGY